MKANNKGVYVDFDSVWRPC